jgi:signal transduction histidine kinase
MDFVNFPIVALALALICLIGLGIYALSLRAGVRNRNEQLVVARAQAYAMLELSQAGVLFLDRHHRLLGEGSAAAPELLGHTCGPGTSFVDVLQKLVSDDVVRESLGHLEMLWSAAPTAVVDATANPLWRVHAADRHLSIRFSRLVVDGQVHHIIVSIERIAAPRVVPVTIEVPVLNADTFARKIAGAGSEPRSENKPVETKGATGKHARIEPTINIGGASPATHTHAVAHVATPASAPTVFMHADASVALPRAPLTPADETAARDKTSSTDYSNIGPLDITGDSYPVLPEHDPIEPFAASLPSPKPKAPPVEPPMHRPAPLSRSATQRNPVIDVGAPAAEPASVKTQLLDIGVTTGENMSPASDSDYPKTVALERPIDKTEVLAREDAYVKTKVLERKTDGDDVYQKTKVIERLVEPDDPSPLVPAADMTKPRDGHMTHVVVTDPGAVVDSHDPVMQEVLGEIMHIDAMLLEHFLAEAREKAGQVRAIIRLPARDPQAFREKLVLVLELIRGIHSRAARLPLPSVISRATVFEDALGKLRDRPNLSGNDFLPLAVKLDDLLSHLAIQGEVVMRLREWRLQTGTPAPTARSTGATGPTMRQPAINIGATTTAIQPPPGLREAQKGGLAKESLEEAARFLSEMYGKQASLVVVGLEDVPSAYKQAVEKVLVQLIHNAIRHGIELPSDRVVEEKPELGTIAIQFARAGADGYQLSVQDDGRGLDHEKIRAEAVRQGVLTADAAASIDQRKLSSLIFRPGFTTVENGGARGIGMDQVREIVTKLGGRVGIATKPGEYTRFRITLPHEKKGSNAAVA